MKTQLLAILAATALAGGAFAQTAGSPPATVPSSPAPGTSPTGGMDSSGATGTAAPSSPSSYPSMTGTGKSQQPAPMPPPYIVPAHPGNSSGDDGGTAGKTNPS